MSTSAADDVLTRIDHVGLAVPDLDEAIAFYAGTFDVHVVHEEVNEEQGVREAMLAVGDSGSCIQLLAPLSPTSHDRAVPGPRRAGRPAGGVPGRRRRGGQRRRCAAAGVRLLYDEPRRGTAGCRVNFVHPKDAGGVLVELVEAAPATGH